MKTKLGGWEAPTFQEERDRARLEENQRKQASDTYDLKEEEAKISPTSQTRLFQLTKN